MILLWLKALALIVNFIMVYLVLSLRLKIHGWIQRKNHSRSMQLSLKPVLLLLVQF